MSQVAVNILRPSGNLISPVATEQSVPQVFFNLSLADQIGNIEFDTEAYGDYLRSRGIDDQAVADTKVHFKVSPGSTLNGWYSRENTVMDINLGPKSTTKTAQTVLYHETEHRIDHVKDQDTSVVGAVGSKLGMMAGALGSIVGIGLVLASPEHQDAGVNALFGGASAVVGGWALYWFDPCEVRARKAAQTYTAPLMSFVR